MTSVRQGRLAKADGGRGGDGEFVVVVVVGEGEGRGGFVSVLQ